MHLTRFTDYSLRVLMYLALTRERLVTIEDIATAYDISQNHLMKVVHHLGRSGVVETVRGKGGGMRLALEPAQISLGRVVREAEGAEGPVECFGEHDTCRITPHCRLAGVLGRAFQALYAELDRYSLADVVVNPKPLMGILNIVPVHAPSR